MSADRDIRRLNKLLDVSSTGIVDGDVPTWDTNVSSFTMASGQGGFDMTVGGNSTSGGAGFALISTGTMTLAGGTNITLSQDGNAVTIMGGAGGGGTQTFIGGIVGSDATYTSGTVSFSGVGGGVTVHSNTGQRVDISVAAPVAQSVQTQNVIDMTLDGNTAGALALMSSGTVTLAGGNNITLSQAGNAVTVSAANQSVQPETQTFLGAIQNSQTTYTSGTVSLSVVAGNLTIRSTTGQAFQFSASQTVQTQNVVDVTAAGNTAGVLALISSGTMTLAGGNNITISQAGNALTISGPNQAADTQTAISGIANSQTTYTSGTVSLAELGAITIRSTTGNQFQFSVNSQSVQPETQTFVAGIGNSQTTYTSGTVNLSVEGGNMTIRSTTGQAFRFSISQSAQAAQTGISGIVGSDATYTSGTVTFTGVGGGITVSSNTGQRIDISVAAPIAATNLSIGVSSGGNTQGNTTVNTGSRFVLVGTNNITLSQATAAGATTVSISGNATTPSFSAGVSNTGNTAGSTGVTGTRVVLVGTNDVSLSQSTDANGGTVSINVTHPAVTNFSAGVSNTGNTAGATGVTGTRLVLVGTNAVSLSQTTDANGGTVTWNVATTPSFSAGVSNTGNTAGATGVSGTRLVLVGTNNITLSQTTDASGATVSISAPNVGAGAFSGGISNLGNTAGSTGVTGTRLVLVATGDLSLSQSTDANGGTVTFTGPQEGTVSMWPDPIAFPLPNTTAVRSLADFGTSAAGASTRTTVTLGVFPVRMDNYLSANQIRIGVNMSYTTATTNQNFSFTAGMSLGIYTLTGSSLSLLSSFSNKQVMTYQSAAASTNASATWSMSYGSSTALSFSTSLSTNNAGVTGFWSSISGIKAIPFASGAFSVTPGQYFGALGFSSSTAGSNLVSLSQFLIHNVVTGVSQDIGKNVASTTGFWPLLGQITGTQTDTAMPGAFSTSDMTTATNNSSQNNKIPFVQMMSQF